MNDNNALPSSLTACNSLQYVRQDSKEAVQKAPEPTGVKGCCATALESYHP